MEQALTITFMATAIVVAWAAGYYAGSSRSRSKEMIDLFNSAFYSGYTKGQDSMADYKKTCDNQAKQVDRMVRSVMTMMKKLS